MNSNRFQLCACVLLLILVVPGDRGAAGELPIGAAAEPSTVLRRYVEKEDASYDWKLKRTGEVGATEYAELVLTSQTWRNIAWKHQLFVLNPSTSQPDESHCLMVIAGGSWNDELESSEERLPREAGLYAAIAESLGTPVVILLQVPHQPMFRDLYEDEIISYTFEEFIKSGDEEWPLLLPMVKSAVRAMDAAEEFAERQWDRQMRTFTVTGASKRGWTTWLTGAVDERAVAIAPMVIDVLNFVPQMRNQIATWGEYSEQIADYTEKGLQHVLETRLGEGLREIVDPYHYLDDLTQPKLIMIGTNDRYWTLDALNLYWDDLGGKKHILYVPNQGHDLADLDRVLGGINGLHRQARGMEAMPELSWRFGAVEGDTELSLESTEAPEQVRVWIATSESRDFREARWTSRAAERTTTGFRYRLAAPDEGFVALFGEYKFRRGTLPMYLSTNVRIVGAAND